MGVEIVVAEKTTECDGWLGVIERAELGTFAWRKRLVVLRDGDHVWLARSDTPNCIKKLACGSSRIFE